MKNLKFLVLGLISMFVFVNVNALDVTTWEALETCLAGSETTCTVTDDLSFNSGSKTLTLNGKTIVLQKTIEVSGEATLTINGNGNVNGTISTGLINARKGGIVTVNGGSFKNEAVNAKCFGIYGSETDDSVKTTLTIAEGVKLSANYGVVIGYASTASQASYGVEVNYAGDYEGITGNGTYKDGTIGISTNGYIKKTTGNIPVVNITGGSIKAKEGTTGNTNKDDAPAIYAAGYAKWNISDGTIEGSEALSIKAGEFNVTGGTLKAFGVYVDPALPENSGSEATGAAISITANDGYAKAVKLTVTDATVESENGHAVYEGKSASQTTALADDGLKLEGGTYTASKDAVKVNNAEGFVTGGTYSSDLEEEYLATNLVTKKDEDGNYVVGVEYTITVEETENGEVVVDNTKAFVGETITITTTPNENYALKELVVKDAANNEVTVTDGKFIMPESNVVITTTFEEIITEVEIPVLDAEKEVEEVTIGVKDDDNTVEQVLLDSIKEDSELSEKVKDTSVNVVVDITKVDEEQIAEEVKESIEEKAGKATIAEYFDISIIVKNAKDNTEIDKLTDLSKEIELMILLPENLKNTNNKVDREYFVIREHDNTVEKLNAELSEDGKYLVFKSKNFSTYALAYQDTEKVENPSTGDNVMLYAILGLVSVIGLTVVIKKRSFN